MSEGRETSLETDALFESAEPATSREKRFRHAADAESFDELVVTEVFGGRAGYERTKVPWPRSTARHLDPAVASRAYSK